MCKGNVVAKRCEAGGGVKADFTTYILELSTSIGYSPSTGLVDDVGDEHDKILVDQQDGGIFTPVKRVSETNKFAGVSIKGIPQDTDQGKVVELLVESGLDASKTEKIAFRDIQDVLSEFNSCNSTLESSTSEASEDSEDVVGKRKRKTKKFPGRDHFLKKINRQVSPK